MSSKTKIVVLKMKELVYTAIFLILGIVLLVLLYCMFRPQKEPDADTRESVYIPGIYTSSISLGTRSLDVEVTVDASRIRSVRLVHLDEAITTLYPLVENAIDNISLQIVNGQSPDDVTYTDDMKYTSMLLLEAVEHALDRAKIKK